MEARSDLGDRFDLPQLSVDAQLEEGRDQAAEVMTKNLGENLVHLSDFRLGANAGAKLGLNHAARLPLRGP